MPDNVQPKKRRTRRLPTTVSMHTRIVQFKQELHRYVHGPIEDRDELARSAGQLLDLQRVIDTLLKPVENREAAIADLRRTLRNKKRKDLNPSALPVSLSAMQLLQALRLYLTGSTQRRNRLMNVCGREIYAVREHMADLMEPDREVRERAIRATAERPSEFPKHLVPILKAYYKAKRRRIW